MSAILLIWALLWAIIVQYCTTLNILLCYNILGHGYRRLPGKHHPDTLLLEAPIR